MIDQERPARVRQVNRNPLPHTTPPPRPRRINHEGRYARLEPMTVDIHGDDLWALARSAEALSTWEYLPYGPFADKDAYFAQLRAWQSADDPLFFAIRDLASEKTVGLGTLMRITPESHSIEIGHLWFSPKLQRTPAATEAIFLMLKHAMDDLCYRRMEWKCNAANEPSRRAARRFGYTFEGIFYQHTVVKGCNRDTAWYSILDGEWPAIRANFEAWLAPANFDADGNQNVALADLNAALQRT